MPPADVEREPPVGAADGPRIVPQSAPSRASGSGQRAAPPFVTTRTSTPAPIQDARGDRGSSSRTCRRPSPGCPAAARARRAGRSATKIRSAPGTTPSFAHSIGWRTSSRTPVLLARRALRVQVAHGRRRVGRRAAGRIPPTRRRRPRASRGRTRSRCAAARSSPRASASGAPSGRTSSTGARERHQPADVARERARRARCSASRDVARGERLPIARVDDRARPPPRRPRTRPAPAPAGRISRPSIRGPAPVEPAPCARSRPGSGRARRAPAPGTPRRPPRRARRSGSRTAPRPMVETPARRLPVRRCRSCRRRGSAGSRRRPAARRGAAGCAAGRRERVGQRRPEQVRPPGRPDDAGCRR